MIRIGDNGCKSIKFLANVKHIGIGCLFSILFIINGIIYIDFPLYVRKMINVRIKDLKV